MTEEEKYQRKIEKLQKKIEKKQRINQFLTDFNDLLGDSNNKEPSYSFWDSEDTEEKVEGYEPYQLEEEELEDDDLYEEGED